MSELALSAQNLSVAYGMVEVLHGASIKVPVGQIVTVIGRMVQGRPPCSPR